MWWGSLGSASLDSRRVISPLSGTLFMSGRKEGRKGGREGGREGGIEEKRGTYQSVVSRGQQRTRKDETGAGLEKGFENVLRRPE